MGDMGIPPNNTGKTYKKGKVNDPRVLAFKAAYLDIHNPVTFCNIRQSALLAGFSETYALNLSRPSGREAKWWTEFKQEGDFLRAELLRKSEEHFYNVMQTPDNTPDKERYKLKQRTAEFVSERVGKEIYSTRQEVTGADGRHLFGLKERESKQVPLKSLFKGVKATDQ